MQVNILVDGNEVIGLGHLYRCAEIANQLRRKQIDVCFFTPSSITFPLLSNFETIKVPSEIWIKPSQSRDYWLSFFNKNDIILFDLIETKFIEFKFLEEYNYYIASLTLFLFQEENYFGNISFFPTVEKFQKKINKTILFASPEFFIIRDEIKSIRNHIKKKREVHKILLTMGGSDPCNIIPKIIKSLDLLQYNFECIVIAGQANKNKKSVLELIRNKNRFTYIEKVDNIETIYSDIDFAIINGGNTRYELSFLQIPYFCISIHDTQHNISQKVIDRFGGVNLGVYYKITEKYIADKISVYLKDPQNFNEIKKKMSDFPSGDGAKILVEMLLENFFSIHV